MEFQSIIYYYGAFIKHPVGDIPFPDHVPSRVFCVIDWSAYTIAERERLFDGLNNIQLLAKE